MLRRACCCAAFALRSRLVGQTLARCDATDVCPQRVIHFECRVVVEAENEFSEVALQVLLVHVLIDTNQTALSKSRRLSCHRTGRPAA